MATKKKTAYARGSSGRDGGGGDIARGFAVVVEEMRGHFRVFGERLDGFGQRLDRVDERLVALDRKVDLGFAKVDARFEQIDRRFEQVDRQFVEVRGHLGQVDEQLADLNLEMGRVKTAVLEHGQRLRHAVRRDEVEGLVEGVLARKRG